MELVKIVNETKALNYRKIAEQIINPEFRKEMPGLINKMEERDVLLQDTQEE
jgi:hypothetical protein